MSELLTKFEKAFEKGLKGEVESFNIWLEKQGINSLKFKYNVITNDLLHDHIYIDHEKEIETVAEFIGFYLREKKEVFHLPIIGVFGIGKTAFLHMLEFILSKIGTEIKFKYYDASTFCEQNEEDEEQQLFYKYLEEVKSEKYDVLLIDSCERDKNIDYSLRKLVTTMKNGVLITAWEPQFWFMYKEKVEEVVSTAKQIFLEQLNRNETKQMLDKIVGLLGQGIKLPDEVAENIFQLSKGIPRITINLLLRSFYEAFLLQKKSVDSESVDCAAKSLGIIGLDEKLEKLTYIHTLTLRSILQSTDTRGIRPSELVEKLNRDKATISYHLNYLSSENLLGVRRVGRYVFYQIKEELKPFIQLKIMEESDFLA